MKKLIGQLHLWLGLTSGLVVLVVALSGSVLVFEKEIDEAVNHDFYFAKSAGSRLPVDALLKSVKAYDPELQIGEIEYTDGGSPRNFLVGGKKVDATWVVAVNPYTAKVAGMINHDKRFFTVMLHLHRYLLAGETGKAITGISCLIFITLISSGLVLWWPKRLRNLKQRLQVKWSAQRKRIVWDFHAVGGFYAHLLLLVLAVTGLTWSYKWFNNGIFLLFDGKPMAKYKAPENKAQQPAAAGFYEQVFQLANNKLAYPGKLTISLPENDSLALTVTKENHAAAITNVVDYLYVERGSGSILKERLYRNESRGMKVRRLIYPIHTGQIYGLPTKIIAFLVCLVAASLPVTGVMVWLGRKKKKAMKNRTATHLQRKGLQTLVPQQPKTTGTPV